MYVYIYDITYIIIIMIALLLVASWRVCSQNHFVTPHDLSPHPRQRCSYIIKSWYSQPLKHYFFTGAGTATAKALGAIVSIAGGSHFSAIVQNTTIWSCLLLFSAIFVNLLTNCAALLAICFSIYSAQANGGEVSCISVIVIVVVIVWICIVIITRKTTTEVHLTTFRTFPFSFPPSPQGCSPPSWLPSRRHYSSLVRHLPLTRQLTTLPCCSPRHQGKRMDPAVFRCSVVGVRDAHPVFAQRQRQRQHKAAFPALRTAEAWCAIGSGVGVCEHFGLSGAGGFLFSSSLACERWRCRWWICFITSTKIFVGTVINFTTGAMQAAAVTSVTQGNADAAAADCCWLLFSCAVVAYGHLPVPPAPLPPPFQTRSHGWRKRSSVTRWSSHYIVTS